MASGEWDEMRTGTVSFPISQRNTQSEDELLLLVASSAPAQAVAEPGTAPPVWEYYDLFPASLIKDALLPWCLQLHKARAQTNWRSASLRCFLSKALCVLAGHVVPWVLPHVSLWAKQNSERNIYKSRRPSLHFLSLVSFFFFCKITVNHTWRLQASTTERSNAHCFSVCSASICA